jgi:hypothetical protein
MLIYHTMVEGTLLRRRSTKGCLMLLLMFFHMKLVDKQDGRVRVDCAEVCDRLLFSNPIKADLHIACRAHAAAMPFPCHAPTVSCPS